MESPGGTFAASLVGSSEDFAGLLRRKGLLAPVPGSGLAAVSVSADAFPQTQATTILAFKFSGGVMVAGDRRATAGNTVVYDRADKVLEIDRHSIMAIAGVPATAWEMARVLEHSFQFFRRTQLQEMSVDGKVRALSKLLRDNFGFVMQGVGVVVPIFATYDATMEPGARLYFYDAMGANFEVTEYAATGSGSPAVRGVLHYENQWGRKPLSKLSEDEAVTLALRALDTAAETDTATGGVDRHARIFPVIKIVSKEGITTLADKQIASLVQERRGMTEEPYRWVEAIANRREYIETQLASGSPIVALGFRDGILFVTLGRSRQKVFEIYDRIAMGAIGHPGDIERLRMAAIELASTEGFTRSVADVSLRRLAYYSLSPVLKAAFEQVFGAPYLARMLFAEIAEKPEDDLFLRVEYDGAIAINGGVGRGAARPFGAVGGHERGYCGHGGVPARWT